MLACARIGAVHSVVFGGFAANELATRIDDAKPKVILSASCGIEPGRIVALQAAARRGDRARRAQARRLPHPAAAAGRPATLIAGPRPRLDGAARRRHRLCAARCGTACRSRPPIRSTSSTPPAPPARPKGVVRDNGGHMVALKWSMKNLYGVEPGEVYLGRLRRRLGGRPLLHRLCAAAARLHHRSSTRASRSARPTPARSGA